MQRVARPCRMQVDARAHTQQPCCHGKNVIGGHAFWVLDLLVHSQHRGPASAHHPIGCLSAATLSQAM